MPVVPPAIAMQPVPQEVWKNQGDGSAYQSVAQSAALAVQDATDFMRATEQIGLAAIAACTEMFVKTKDVSYMAMAQTIGQKLAEVPAIFTAIGTAAAGVLAGFPAKGAP